MRAAKIKGEDIATENYNTDRNWFVQRSWILAKKDNAVHRAAIEHYDVIQRELNEYEKFIKK
tara:strand:+ start:485 stop:670 length:186 start_codon:yes stop_codon:yes gene_type:complete